MALKIAKALSRNPSVKMMIHRRLAGWEEPRLHGTVHASDLMRDLEFCPREWALLDQGAGKKKDSFVGTALRVTYDHGKSLEYNLRNKWVRDAVVGLWKCQYCKRVHPTIGKYPKVSCACGASMWEYKEVDFVSPASGISGALDVLVDVNEPRLLILEVKSMDKDEHRKLVAPLAEHKFRTALYLRLAEESLSELSSRVNWSRANILYVSKSFGFKDETIRAAGIKDSHFSPFKEFEIVRDDSITHTPVAKATVLHRWRTEHIGGMPCGVCTNGLLKRAQQCSAVGACFSGSYPATLTWLENGKVRHPGKNVVS